MIANKILKGPDIHVTFKTSGKQITSVCLKSSSSGLTWDISGEATAHLKWQIEEWLKSYCDSSCLIAPLPLDLSTLPPFTAKVLKILAEEPFGSLITYQELAIKAGNPKAARAAGSACAKNPFLLVVPCHRVITSKHTLGGFSAGLELKKTLLAFEACLV